MAIRNKMVAEGLDPNLLEWVARVICVPTVEHFTKISNTFLLLLLTEHQMHPCLTEGSGAPRIKMLRAPAPTASRHSATEARFPSLRSFLQMWAGLWKEKDVPQRGWQNKCLKQEVKTQSDFRIKVLIISTGSLPELWLFPAWFSVLPLRLNTGSFVRLLSSKKR